jgi:hypothetical protein
MYEEVETWELYPSMELILDSDELFNIEDNEEMA